MNKPTYDELIAALSESDYSNIRIKYGKVKAERDALAGQVEHYKALSVSNGNLANENAMRADQLGIENQRLIAGITEIKAQAVEDFDNATFNGGSNINKTLLSRLVKDYALQLRQQAKVGE